MACKKISPPAEDQPMLSFLGGFSVSEKSNFDPQHYFYKLDSIEQALCNMFSPKKILYFCMLK
jgi:hypothetical protein